MIWLITVILINVLNGLAPSIFAASITDIGKLSINCFIKNKPIGAAKAGTGSA